MVWYGMDCVISNTVDKHQRNVMCSITVFLCSGADES